MVIAAIIIILFIGWFYLEELQLPEPVTDTVLGRLKYIYYRGV